MSFTSLPSKKAIVVDVPEVNNFSGTFFYTFFTPDERVASTSTSPILQTDSSGGQITPSGRRLGERVLLSNTPRHITLSWSPTVTGLNSRLIETYSVREHASKIQSERLISSGDFSSFVFQDTGIDGKMALYVRKALEVLVPPTATNSSLEHARALDGVTSNQVSLDFLANALQTTQGATFGTRPTTILEELQQVGLRVQINKRVVNKVLRSVQEDVTTPFTDEVTSFLGATQELQDHAKTALSSQVISSDDYDYEIRDYVSVRKADAQSFDPTFQTIGYVIDKWEIDSQLGTTTKVESLFIESPLVASVVDPAVKYGATYTYTITTIVYVEVQAHESDGDLLVAVGFLIGSKPSPTVVVRCVENVPPPPPADFNVAWDYQNKCARITWSFPVTSQRDVKKFQVFRRQSIDQPFELVAMFDFDDSVVKTQFNETPDPTLVEQMKNPKSYFLDRGFTKETTWIYALCCIDAHGLSSNYSMQLEASFDKFSNKMTKKLISSAGAPKTYPNALVSTDMFVDTIKDEGHKKLTIYFDPEFIKVRDGQGNDVGLLKTHTQDKYMLQVLNVDLQKQRIFTFKLDDRSS